MIIKTLGISTSPRIHGNSDLLLREALSGAESAGAKTEYIHLSDYDIAPCIECNACYSRGDCKIQDDFQQLLKKILDADRLIFATPVFFMTVCAQAKMLIDRSQCLWAYKYVLHKQLFSSERDRRAMVIAVGGSKSKKQFECIRFTMKSYFDVLDINYSTNLFTSKVDDIGEIHKHPTALKEAFRLGNELIAAESPPPQKPINIELF
ncbi:MAG: flavodoxin family protein [Planctomycetes bacterium]|nr:flavodoxin family protein [Planctomycetota bacterium]MBL7142625.1 flavodoxin family protein [Phycisphaerae bacterium]